MDDNKSIIEICSDSIQTEYENAILNISGTVKLCGDTKITDCIIRYSANGSNQLLINQEVLFTNCSFECTEYEDDDKCFLVVSKKGSLCIRNCQFDSCEKFIEAYDKFNQIEIHDSKIINPGNLFLNIQAQDDAKILLNNLDVRLLKGVSYSGHTTVFRIARWGEQALIDMQKIRIISATLQENVKWFDCMGASLTEGEFTNLTNVLFGFQNVTNTNFKSCKKVINWSFPVIQNYSISKNTISWTNMNTKIKECNFTNCTMVIGLGHLASVISCKFSKCFAPVIVVGQLGGTRISNSDFKSCVLDDNDNNALIVCVVDQDKDFSENSVIDVRCKNIKLKKDKFVKIGLTKLNNGFYKAYKPVYRFENLKFFNCGLESQSQLIQDRFAVSKNISKEVVRLIAPIDFYNEPVSEEIDDAESSSDRTGVDWFGEI